MHSSATARFSSAATTYHRLAAVQRRVAADLIGMLRRGETPARILEIGCGTGILTAMLADTFPRARIDAIEVSSAMIEQARRNLAGNARIGWIAADIRQADCGARYDLIASNCVLHWVRPLGGVFRKASALLNPGGRFIFSIMLRGTFSELNACRRRAAPGKRARVVLPSAAEVKRAVVGAGLRLISEATDKISHEFPSAEVLLARLHGMGVTGANVPAAREALTRGELARLARDYNTRYPAASGHGVCATYRCLRGLAVKRNAVGGM